MLGLLGLRIFEACASSIADLGEEHGHRVLRVCGKGNKVVLVPLPPAGRAGYRPRHRRPHRRAYPAQSARPADGPPRRHPTAQAPRHRRRGDNAADASAHAPAYVRLYQLRRGSALATSKSPPATPTREPPCATTALARTSTATPTTSSRPSWPPAPERSSPADVRVPRG